MADSPTLQAGTAANERLSGTAGTDIIFGQGGADTLIGGGGDDNLNSGEYVDATAPGGSRMDHIGDLLDGGTGNDLLVGGSGNDLLIGGIGTNSLHGGEGYDTAIYSGVRADYTVAMFSGIPAGVRAMSGASQSDTLAAIERISFSDISIAYDIQGNAGKMFRLYQAAFNREPDLEGLGYWIKAADTGVSWKDISLGFTTSKEWTDLYGSTSPDETFVANLYRYALHREYDQEGFDYWMDRLDTGLTREEMVIDFAESPENQAAVIGQIRNGIEYELFTG